MDVVQMRKPSQEEIGEWFVTLESHFQEQMTEWEFDFVKAMHRSFKIGDRLTDRQVNRLSLILEDCAKRKFGR